MLPNYSYCSCYFGFHYRITDMERGLYEFINISADISIGNFLY